MAGTSKIKFTISDGNLISVIAGTDHVSSLVFDVSAAPTATGATLPLTYQIFSLEEAVDLGITPYVILEGETDDDGYEGGTVHKHISDFFAINPNGELYVGLANCSVDFSYINTVQSVAQGRIRQLGIYTQQDLFTAGSPYTVNLVTAINSLAEADAVNNKPYSVILHANVATVGGVDVEYLDIPTAISVTNKRVSLNIGQEDDSLTKAIQNFSTSKASVGSVGAFIGAVSLANVHESIGWTAKFNLAAAVETIAFGWGGVVTDINDNTPYEDIDQLQLDALKDNGYIFPIRYTDLAGVYAVNQGTLSSGDYNTIARNRTIDKSRRNVRLSLLPTIQQPLYVDATTGEVSVGTIGSFRSIVHTQLSALQAAGEISGFSILIDPNQNILNTNTFNIEYNIVPVGTNDQIVISIGLATQI